MNTENLIYEFLMYLKSDNPYVKDSGVKILLDPSGQDVEILCNCFCLCD